MVRQQDIVLADFRCDNENMRPIEISLLPPGDTEMRIGGGGGRKNVVKHLRSSDVLTGGQIFISSLQPLSVRSFFLEVSNLLNLFFLRIFGKFVRQFPHSMTLVLMTASSHSCHIVACVSLMSV